VLESLGLLLATAACDLMGFACLALTRPRHWKEVTGTAAPPARRARALRLVGFPLLVAGGLLAILRDGPGFGSLLAVLAWTASAWVVAFTLTWRPRWLRPVAMIRRSG
jgi:hypothetical protein